MDSNESLVEELETFLTGSVIVFIGTVLGSGATFVSRLAAARYFQPSSYGSIVLLLTVINIILTLSLLGLPGGLSRYIPRKSAVGGLFLGSITYALASYTILALSFYLTQDYIISQFGLEEITNLLWIGFLALPLFISLRLISGTLRGLELSSAQVIVNNIFNQTLRVFLIFIGIFFGLSVSDFLIVWFAPLLVSVIVGLQILNRQGTFDKLSEKFDFDLSKELLYFSLPLMLSSASWILMSYTDNLLISMYSSGTDVGIYDASFTISRIMTLIISGVSFLFMPIFSRLDYKDKTENMTILYKTATKWMSFATIPIFIIILFNSRTILSVVYGNAYSEGSATLIIATLGFFLHSVFGHNGDALIAAGENRLILVGNVFSLGINLILNIVLIPGYGITGAAVASACSFTLLNVFWSSILYHKLKIQPFSKRLVYVGVLSFGFAYGIFNIISLPSGTLIETLIKISLYVIIHTMLSLIVGISEIDRDVMQNVMSKI